MRLIFLGTGSAFHIDQDNYQSNMILHEGNNNLLIDCGSDVRHALNRVGLTYKDITDVYISHFHADHIGGLEWLGFTRKYNQSPGRPKLHVHESMVDILWNNALKAGMYAIGDGTARLETYFDVQPVGPNLSFNWCHAKINLIRTIHVAAGQNLVPSYGLMIVTNNLNVLITTDTQFTPDESMRFYQQANLIFHDCETTPKASGVHARYEQLCTLPMTIKQKMWLYHYEPGNLPDAKKDGFLGFVQRGQCFNLDSQGVST